MCVSFLTQDKIFYRDGLKMLALIANGSRLFSTLFYLMRELVRRYIAYFLGGFLKRKTTNF